MEAQQNIEMISFKTICQGKIVFPAQLAILATQGTYVTFQSKCNCINTRHDYLVTTQPQSDIAQSRRTGHPEVIDDIYRSIPWPEFHILVGDELFYYKNIMK